ncbi:hypothetical protein AXX12_01035 [Anaerosporomusa subterranea]|uniref:Uncharacterized protein n=1 Tax=Anaerosporomusa subterranea TaxID=1794912 RepID=A0A154BWJ4_ANASB|nr:hypothetical protein [Anaerosporomusa subterranea]KYZ78160.1 hypothetical protein AXX12_01035 [Anaerosporomusa subterranea]
MKNRTIKERREKRRNVKEMRLISQNLIPLEKLLMNTLTVITLKNYNSRQVRMDLGNDSSKAVAI